jgi:SAM-dependent methyltransferase
VESGPADPPPADAGPLAGAPSLPAGPATPVDLETYYTEAGMDYRAWSRGFNMHFGYWRRWLDPLALERMLEEMSLQVFERLRLAPGMKVLDLGCGLGAPARTLVSRHAVALTAVTLVPWQIEKARALTAAAAAGAPGTVEWILGDYTALDLPAGAYDAAFSIEASCHAPGAAKEPFVAECARLLRPGGRLVVADGFMKRDRVPRWYGAVLGFMTRRWAVERFAHLGQFTAALERHGLAVEAVEDASFRIAPSVLHVPWVTVKFLAGELLRRERLSGVRWGHVLACVIAPFVGIGRPWFGYYLITARKP